MTEAPAVYTPPPGLLDDLGFFESVATLTHAGDELRHLFCFGREQTFHIHICYCIYCWDDHDRIARAEYLATSTAQWTGGFGIPLCGDCAREIRRHLEERR